MEKMLTPTNYEWIPLDDKTNVRFYTSIDPGSYVAPRCNRTDLSAGRLTEGNS